MKSMFGNSKRRKKEQMELDITSLLDVLVILLVFLLKSYNASDLKLNLVQNLDVASSQARKLGSHAIIVQVDKDQNIFVNKKSVSNSKQGNEFLQLKSELMKMKGEGRTPAEKKAKNINLVFDKSLPYKTVKSIMHTSALAGYTEFKFIVQGNF